MAATHPRRLANLAALNNARNVALAAQFESQPANTNQKLSYLIQGMPDRRWKFFAAPSLQEIVSHVEMKLINGPNGFIPSHVPCRKPLFEAQKDGWGTFKVTTTLLVKIGWEVCVETPNEDSPTTLSK